MIFNKEEEVHGEPLPGGGGSGNGSGRGPTPPDVDKIIKRISRKNKKIFTWRKFIRRKTSDFSFNNFRVCLVGKWSL